MAGLPGVGATAAALAVSVVSGIAFAYALVRLAEHVPGGSRRAGLVLVALVAAAPMGVVFSMGYSEALFCALAAWALVGVLQRQWVLAGACCAAAGLVRPTAAALIAAVGLAALVAITRRRDSWRPWAAATLAPLGLAAYLGFVALRTGQWDGWFTLQRRGWGLAFDGGPSTLRFTREVLVTAPSVLEVVTVAVLAVLRRARCHRHGEQLVRRLLAHRLAVRDLASRAPRPGSEVDLVRLPLPAHCRVSAPHSLTSIISTSTSAGPILLPTGTSRAYTSQLDSKGQIPGTCVSQTLTPSSSTGSRSLDPRTPAKSSETTPVMRWR